MGAQTGQAEGGWQAGANGDWYREEITKTEISINKTEWHYEWQTGQTRKMKGQETRQGNKGKDKVRTSVVNCSKDEPLVYLYIQASHSTMHTNTQPKWIVIHFVYTYCIVMLAALLSPHYPLWKNKRVEQAWKEGPVPCNSNKRAPTHVCRLLAEILGLKKNRPV